MVDFDNHEHNDLISVEVRIDEILRSEGDNRAYKFTVSTPGDTQLKLSIWDESPAVDTDWKVGHWYRLEGALVKKWSSMVELNGANKTTAKQIDTPDTADYLHDGHNFISKQDTSLMHVGPINYASSNITARRKEEFQRALDAAIETAIQQDVDSIVLTGQLFATQSPAKKDIRALRESLNELRNNEIPLLLAGSSRDHEFALVDKLISDGLVKQLSSSPVVIGDVAVYGTSPVDSTNVLSELRSLDPIPPNVESSVLAVPETIAPPVSDATLSVDDIQSASSVSFEAIMAGDPRHRESHAPTEVSDCQVFQAGPAEYLLRKWALEDPPEYPCSIRIIGPSTTEQVSIPHRPFVLYRVECPSAEDLQVLKNGIEAADRTVLVQLVGAKGSEPLLKNSLETWLQEQTSVSKVWDDRSKSTEDRPLSVETLTSEPPVELSSDFSTESQEASSTEAPSTPPETNSSATNPDTQTADSRLYFAPCDNPILSQYFDETILTGITEKINIDVTDNKISDPFYVWGIPEQKAERYRNMGAGDFVLFYTNNGKYEYAAEITAIEHNSRVVDSLEQTFSNNDIDTKALDRWDYCLHLQSPFEVAIQGKSVHGYAGHTSNKPFNFSRLNKQGREAIRQEYGSIRSYLQSHGVEDHRNTLKKNDSETDTEFDSSEEVIELVSEKTGATTSSIGRDVSKLAKRDISLSTIFTVLRKKYDSDSTSSILSVDAVGVVRAARFQEAGYTTITDLATTPVSELSAVTEISKSAAEVMRGHAKELQSDENTAEQIASQSGCDIESVERTLKVVGATGVPRSEARQIVTDLHTNLSLLDIDGLQRRASYHLVDHGYKTPGAIVRADPDELIEVPQIGEGNVDTIQDNAADIADTDNDDPEDHSETQTSENPSDDSTDNLDPSLDEPPEVERLAAISGLDQGHIQDTLRQIEFAGCSPEEAREWYCQYLADVLREQGIFALEGVGPLSGRQLVESGITQIDDLQTAVPERIASETQFSVDQVEELQQATRDERYESLDANNSELVEHLIKTYSTAITDKRITRNRANELLAQSVGHQAEFRPQQWKAIDKLANERDQLLLVQRTGWGKSTVYFIATKSIRNDGGGPTLIISPLLSLMRDQIKNAEEELGLTARTINSRNEEDWEQIYEDIIEGDCDLVLVSPERLGNQEFREQVLGQMDDGFGMLVVDEAHCISDWGHDFRPDYQRVTRILDRLPSNVPVAATTATANDRVVDDITTQLPGLEPIRGNLVRDSLRIQAIDMGDRQKRLAWLAENLPEGDRAGIVYCLTIDDVNRVTEWLSKKGYNVNSYHGRLDTDKRQEREQMLLNNDVDALVATNALGMGFDKPDLKYVIHFQRPQNLIRYYQEIGRAGRDLDTADAVVLSGSDDDETAEYFIESSFPSASNFEAVLETISDAEEPLSKWDLRIESDASQVSRCVQMLEVDGALERTDEGYVRTANQWTYDEDKYNRITEQRYTELERIQEFMRTDQCLTLFIDEQLDGQMSEPCGRCANCTGNFYPQTVTDQSLIDEAVKHYQSSGIETISNRVYRYLESGGREKIPPENQLETGRSLSVYEEPGWGTAVREGKYETGQFEESLVTGAVDMIENKWDPSPAPTWITYVPSESSEGLVADYASRLADELGLEIVDCVQKVDDTVPQKELSGSAEKCDNVRGAFEITDDVRSGPVLLIDDIVASRWTLTEVGRQLSKSGSGSVYPFALAKRRG